MSMRERNLKKLLGGRERKKSRSTRERKIEQKRSSSREREREWKKYMRGERKIGELDNI